MAKIRFLLAAVLPLAACGAGDGTNPVFGGGGGGGSVGDLPGTANPTAKSGITRYEAQDGTGSGYARDIAYDADADEFTVNNLAFDGNNVYARSANPALDNLSGDAPTVFAVYEGAGTETDPLTGASIDQFEYRALYGRSRNTLANGDPATEFAIVRTGSYVPYGFGGFLYQRNDGVVLPKTGQAGYAGPYAAVRDFNGRADLEYATGTMELSIDFEDFDAGDAVQGRVTGRAILDSAGNDVTGDVITALEAEYGGTYTALPNLVISVGPGSIDRNGEMKSTVTSAIRNSDGADELLEAGNFYAVVTGNDADEIVGVITVQSDDPRYEGVTVRETGGFILYRP